jgi:hypothetical protein
MIICFGQFFDDYRSSPTFLGPLSSSVKALHNFDKKMCMDFILGGFSQTHLVSLVEAQARA